MNLIEIMQAIMIIVQAIMIIVTLFIVIANFIYIIYIKRTFEWNKKIEKLKLIDYMLEKLYFPLKNCSPRILESFYKSAIPNFTAEEAVSFKKIYDVIRQYQYLARSSLFISLTFWIDTINSLEALNDSTDPEAQSDYSAALSELEEYGREIYGIVTDDLITLYTESSILRNEIVELKKRKRFIFF